MKAMRLAHVVLAALSVLAAPAAAQVYDLTLEAATEVRLEATQGPRSGLWTWPAGYAVEGTRSSVASATWLSGQSAARATLSRIPGVQPGSTVAGIKEQTSTVGTPTSSPSVARCGPHSLRVRLEPLESRPVVSGFVVVQQRKLSGVPAASEGWIKVDFDEDGTNEIQWGLEVFSSFVMRVNARAPEQKILIETYLKSESTAGQSHGYERELTLEFIPDLVPLCVFTQYGTSCGPDLIGTESFSTGRQLTYQVGGTPPSVPGVMIFGLARHNLPLPGGCLLHTEIAALAPLITGPTGGGSLTVAVPELLMGTFNTQFLVLDGGMLRSSGGLESLLRWWP